MTTMNDDDNDDDGSRNAAMTISNKLLVLFTFRSTRHNSEPRMLMIQNTSKHHAPTSDLDYFTCGGHQYGMYMLAGGYSTFRHLNIPFTNGAMPRNVGRNGLLIVKRYLA